MARQQILFDKTEIVAIVLTGNRPLVLNLEYRDISRIQFDRCEERRLLRKVPSEKITIMTSKHEQPVTYTKLKHTGFWDMYKEKLASFAERNHVTFVNNV